MRRSEGIVRWILGPQGLMAFASVFLFLVMAVSFFNIPWPTGACGGDLCEVPATGGDGLVRTLFGPYAILVLVMAVTLAAAMIGGVYLAKDEISKGLRELEGRK